MAKKKFTAVSVLSIRAAANTQKKANKKRDRRYKKAVKFINAGKDPSVLNGVFWLGYDPGDGPCAALLPVTVPANQSGLRESTPR